MVAVTLSLLLSLAASAAAAPAPQITAAPQAQVAKRAASCTFSGSNGAAEAAKSAKSCATMVLSNVAVPSGKPLDLSKLADDTTVIFEGETTFGYAEWKGPLIDIRGNGITVKGGKGHVLNGDGKRWWDGNGGNSGIDKPKFFAAHNLKDSTITGINIKNTPVQAVSVNGCDGLTITDMTIDDSDGDKEGGHNTDGFDIGSSNNIIIDGAKVYNQDDCVAVNSGTVCINSMPIFITITDPPPRKSPSRTVSAPVATAFPSALLVDVTTTPSTL
jgi:polygalacturonase